MPGKPAGAGGQEADLKLRAAVGCESLLHPCGQSERCGHPRVGSIRCYKGVDILVLAVTGQGKLGVLWADLRSPR